MITASITAGNDWRQETPEKILAKFNISTSLMNTVANNIHLLCITSQSRKMNSLAFILECLLCFCNAYNH